MFGDYRPSRYHAGIDLRTDGDEGWPVVAVADGYVMRASTSYYGYGRALYLQLDDGRVAVYGHLQSFGPQVTARVKAEQRRLKRYATNQYFESDAIRVTRGMIIARSGQTGAGAPHLHFELRTANNEPLNPLLNGFTLDDGRDPTIDKLWLVPQYVDGTCGYGPRGSVPQEIDLAGSAQTPLRPAGGKIEAGGPVGFAVEAYDRKAGQSFKSNVFELVFVVAGDTVFQSHFDTLRYETMGQVELERPPELESTRNTYRLFKAPGNRLDHSHVHPAYPRGLVSLVPGDTAVPFEIVVLDEEGNRRTIRGILAYAPPTEADAPSMSAPMRITAEYIERSVTPDSEDVWSREELAPANWIPVPGASYRERLYARRADSAARAGLIRWDVLDMRSLLAIDTGTVCAVALPDSSLMMNVPGECTYAPQWLEIASLPSQEGQPVWRLGPEDVTLKNPVRLSFRAPDDTLLSLCSLNPKTGALGFIERKRENGRIVCTTRQPGYFTFGYDTIPPTIRRLSPTDGGKATSGVIVTARLDDDLSGVGDDTMIEVLIDGTWIVPEYDPETHQLKAEPWSRLSRGPHTLVVRVRDWAGNLAEVERKFRVVK